MPAMANSKTPRVRQPLENESQVMKADDVKGVIDGWVSDLHQSYLKLKSK